VEVQPDDSTLDELPIAIDPIGDTVQRVDVDIAARLSIWLYQGADGRGTLIGE
jgi:hypothetical protein